jgi:hypothetical protein
MHGLLAKSASRAALYVSCEGFDVNSPSQVGSIFYNLSNCPSSVCIISLRPNTRTASPGAMELGLGSKLHWRPTISAS